jgi:hypothetical protein
MLADTTQVQKRACHRHWSLWLSCDVFHPTLPSQLRALLLLAHTSSLCAPARSIKIASITETRTHDPAAFFRFVRCL